MQVIIVVQLMQVTQVIQVINGTQEIQVMQVKQVTFIHIIHIYTYHLSYVRLGHLWSDLWSDWVIFGVLYVKYFCLIVFQVGQLIPIWPIFAPLIWQGSFVLFSISCHSFGPNFNQNFWGRFFFVFIWNSNLFHSFILTKKVQNLEYQNQQQQHLKHQQQHIYHQRKKITNWTRILKNHNRIIQVWGNVWVSCRQGKTIIGLWSDKKNVYSSPVIAWKLGNSRRGPAKNGDSAILKSG